MIELRWLTLRDGVRVLQQRTRQPCVDVSGAFCGFGEWSFWTDVPEATMDTDDQNLYERRYDA